MTWHCSREIFVFFIMTVLNLQLKANESSAASSAPSHANDSHKVNTSLHKEQLSNKASLKSIYNDEFIVSMPLGCLDDGTLPCVFKSTARQTIVINDTRLTLLPQSVVKLIDSSPVLEPLKGSFVIEKSTAKVHVKSYELTQFPSYVTKTKDQVEIIDGRDFYFIKMQADEYEKTLLDKDEFVSKLARYYSNKQLLRSKLKEISIVYDRSFKNDLNLQRKIIQRKLASIEEDKKIAEQKKKEQEDKRKKEQKYFFHRTFER